MEKLSIETIKSHTDIYDIVSQVVRLKKVGSKYVGLCPFHDEKTPSFYVTPAKQIFKCFGCGKGGDVLTFLQLLNYGEVNKDAFREVIKGLSGFNTDTWRTSDEYKKSLPTPSVKEPTYMNPTTVRQTMQRYDENNFVRFLLSVFDKEIVADLIERFSIGTAKYGATVFWQRDQQDNFRTGQRIIFDATTGNRNKDINPFLVHTKQSKDFVLAECFCGEYQLVSEKNKPIAIVESEKTASIMTPIQPRYLWLACCGADRLKAEKCKILVGKNVVLYPDLGKFEDWTQKANEFRKTLKLDVRVSDMLENFVSTLDENVRAEHYKKGYDIADYALQFDWYGEAQKQKVKTISPSKDEQTIQKMLKAQPLIKELIARLGLVNAKTMRPFQNI